MKLNCEVKILIDGKEIRTTHATISNAGFSHFGSRCFNSADADVPVQYIALYSSDTAGGTNSYNIWPNPSTGQHTYAEVSNTSHKVTYTYVWSGATRYLDGCAAVTAVPVTTANTMATASWTEFAVNNGETITVVYIWNLSGTDFTSAGFQLMGHRAFDYAGRASYTTVFNYIDMGGTRTLATYSKISDTVHQLSFTPASELSNATTSIYNASSSGIQGYSKNHGATKTNLAGKAQWIKITLANPSTTVA